MAVRAGSLSGPLGTAQTELDYGVRTSVVAGPAVAGERRLLSKSSASYTGRLVNAL